MGVGLEQARGLVGAVAEEEEVREREAQARVRAQRALDLVADLRE